jgi:hypothetical protein
VGDAVGHGPIVTGSGWLARERTPRGPLQVRGFRTAAGEVSSTLWLTLVTIRRRHMGSVFLTRRTRKDHFHGTA